jgi:hypothetical protein
MTIHVPPPGELELSDPDELTFGEVFAIKAATGVDVLTDGGTEQACALLWFALKQRDSSIQWRQMLDLKPSVANEHMMALAERITKQQAEAERLRNERDEAAAVKDQLRELGEEVPADPAPAKDPS